MYLQIDHDDEVGGHYHFLGKSVSANIELPNQRGPNRYDFFTSSEQPDDFGLLGLLLGPCMFRTEDILFVRRSDSKVRDSLI